MLTSISSHLSLDFVVNYFLAEILQPVLCGVLNERFSVYASLQPRHPLDAVLVAVVVADDATESAIALSHKP